VKRTHDPADVRYSNPSPMSVRILCVSSSAGRTPCLDSSGITPATVDDARSSAATTALSAPVSDGLTRSVK
jgi:hypothetical protein